MENNNQFFTTYAETEDWLNSMNIQNYTINDDLTVDVDGDADINDKNLECIPVKFGIIKGGFDCARNYLTSLKGCPDKVEGIFDCDENQLISLEYSPSEVSLCFWCSDNKLTTLKGAPKELKESFYCSRNQLTSLEGGPEKVGISFHCSNNKITTLEGFLAKIGGVFYCYNNPVTDFNYLNFEVAGDIYFTPTKDIDYLDSYKDKGGNIKIHFNDFKRIQTLKNLENKLNNDLSVKSVKIKHKI